MKKISAMIMVAALALCLTGCMGIIGALREAQQAVTDNPRETSTSELSVDTPSIYMPGEWDGNLYLNESLDLSFALPRDWENREDQRFELQKMAESSGADSFLDLLCSSLDGHYAMMLSVDFGDGKTPIAEEEYLDFVRAKPSNQEYDFYEDGERQMGGKTYRYIRGTRDSQDDTRHSEYMMLVKQNGSDIVCFEFRWLPVNENINGDQIGEMIRNNFGTFLDGENLLQTAAAKKDTEKTIEIPDCNMTFTYDDDWVAVTPDTDPYAPDLIQMGWDPDETAENQRLMKEERHERLMAINLVSDYTVKLVLEETLTVPSEMDSLLNASDKDVALFSQALTKHVATLGYENTSVSMYEAESARYFVVEFYSEDQSLVSFFTVQGGAALSITFYNSAADLREMVPGDMAMEALDQFSYC